MEIAPVSTVRLAPRPSTVGIAQALPEVADAGLTERAGEEPYTPPALRAASGAGEEDDSNFENLSDPDPSDLADQPRRRKISYFV